MNSSSKMVSTALIGRTDHTLARSSADMIHAYRYHSHVNMQAMTAQGPVIVEPKNKTVPIEYDEEIIMMLSDSYHVGSFSASFRRPAEASFVD